MGKEINAISTEEFLQEQTEMNENRRKMLAELLGQTIARQGQFLAFASQMGQTAKSDGSLGQSVPAYTVMHSLDWISQNILLGSEMPFMENKIDHETGRIVVDYTNADEVKQRAPDWTRQAALASYLARPERKFGPIMAVISPAWVEEPNHQNWDENGRALITSAVFSPIEPSGRVGLLKLEGVRLYALDGQHRVLGMRGLRELQERGFLQMRSADGTPRGGIMSKAEFIENFRLEIEDLQAIFNDTMPVEYTPAVVKGETHSEATRRIRRTFIAINSYAKKTDKGENILLDETDGFAIVARRLGVTHPLFKSQGMEQRVNWKSASILSGSSHLTTLSTLKEIAAIYLPAVKPDLYGHWRAPLRGMVPLRPTDDELDIGCNLLFTLFDRILKLSIFQTLQRTDPHEYNSTLNRWREFPDFDVFDPKSSRLHVDLLRGRSRGHLLLRPLGQTILIKALAELVSPKTNGGLGLSLASIFRSLEQLDSNRGFEMARPESIWFGVTYARSRIVVSNKSWAHRLLVHLVGGLKDENEIMALWRNWVSCRTVDTKARTWKDLNGKVIHYDWDKPQLPEPIKE